MNSKVEVQGSRADSVKLALAAAILVAGVVGFYLYQDQSTLLRVLALLVVAGIAVGISLQTEVGRSVRGFLSDAQTEVRKVVWPTRTETVQTSLAVFVVVILIGLFLWLLDMFLLWAVKLLTGQGG